MPLDKDDKAAALATVRTLLAGSADGVLEAIAAEHGLTPRDVADCLPASMARRVDGALFAEVMGDVAAWGEVTVLVHTADVILECRGPLPAGTIARGFYNLNGHGAIGGHLRHGNCTDIHFVSRPFMGMETRSILFFNGAGEAMFKIFVGRDADRRLRPDQVDRFETLRDRLVAPEEASHAAG